MLLIVVASSQFAGAATSSTVVGATVPSATNITIAGCATGTAATTIGSILPGASVTTSTDCVVTFGSSNDTASLRMHQADRADRGMYRPVNGGLDSTFGTAGRTVNATGTGTDMYTTVARDANGMFVAAGHYYNGSRNKIVVARYQANGTLDPGFNGGAVRTIDISGAAVADDVIYSLAVQPDRKIVMAGISNGDSLLMRLNADGTTDWTQVNNLGSGVDWAKGVALQPDGNIVVYGIAYSGAGNIWNMYLERRTPAAGALDTANFGTSGRLVIPSIITAASPRVTVDPPIIQPDGKIVVCDYTTAGGNPDLWIFRTSAAGVLDNGFGTSGRTTIAAPNNDFCGPGVLQADGKLVFPSATTDGLGVGSVRALRLNADGSPDTATWGAGGVAAPAVGDAYIGGVLLQEDGRVVGFGVRKNGATYQGALFRWSTTGVLDTTFAEGSYATADIGNPAIPPAGGGNTWGSDGRTVTATGYWNGSNLDLAIYRMGTTTVPDYGTTNWASTSGTFGACLASVAGGATAAWTGGGGSCTAADNGTWYGIPQTTASTNAVVARSTIATTTAAQANLRFGMRAASAQPPGVYIAPVTFDVVAPMV